MLSPHYKTDRPTLEKECEMTFIKAGGPGGQHRNKRETGVRLLHPPSGLVVEAVERRSQAQNREVAFERLVAKLDALNFVPKKRRPTRIPLGEKKRRLDDKKLQKKKKETRHVSEDE